MSFTNYDNAFTAIYSQVYKMSPEEISFTYLKFQTLRLLDALGHCDFLFESRCVYVCPPSLILVPSFGLPMFLLTGARNPELIARINKFVINNKGSVRLIDIPQRVEYCLLPRAIYLEVMSKDIIERGALKIGVNSKSDEPAAWSLANFTSNISEIEKEMSFELRDKPDWPKRTFSPVDLIFSKYYQTQDDFRLIEYTNPRDQQKLHFLWQGDKGAEVDRDWGRFIVLAKQNARILLYDIRRFLLAVPASIPLPRLIARSLTLCTGLAPSNRIISEKPIKTIPENCRFNIYQSVVPQIAEIVSNKLEQVLIPYNIELVGDEIIL
jgi:hypothetical protein